MQFIIAALKETGGDTDPMKLAEATAGRELQVPFSDSPVTLREDDHTLIGYMVGYSKTLDKDPWITDFQGTAWDAILEHEADWKKRNGFI